MMRMVRAAILLAGFALGGMRAVAQSIRSREGPVHVSREPENPILAVGRLGLRSWLLILAGLGVMAGVGGILTAASGVIPIKASSGHWPITEWFLHFSMKRSIGTHAMGMEAPPLDDWRLVLKGASHYDTGCRPCHGSPELQRPKIARAMTPLPPYLAPRIPEWTPEELFYVVKHGVKFTGMPAWPSQVRDDEVWAMVAFLLKFPKLNLAAYRQLVAGESHSAGGADPMEDLTTPDPAPDAVKESCARCHGLNGAGRGQAAFPNLAGQRPVYMADALQAFARDERHSGIMQPVAAGLSTEEIEQLASYYGGQRRAAFAAPRHESATAISQGQAIAHRGIPSKRVPACAGCHGPGETEHNPAYPRLAGQYSDYLVLQLQLFKSGQRGGSRFAHLMHPIAPRLTADEMQAAAMYYESLGWIKP